MLKQEMIDAKRFIDDGYGYRNCRWYFATTDDANVTIDVLIHIVRARLDCDEEYASAVAYAIKDYCLHKKYIHQAAQSRPSILAAAARELKFDPYTRRWYAWGKRTDYKSALSSYPAYILAEIRYLSHTEGYR